MRQDVSGHAVPLSTVIRARKLHYLYRIGNQNQGHINYSIVSWVAEWKDLAQGILCCLLLDFKRLAIREKTGDEE